MNMKKGLILFLALIFLFGAMGAPAVAAPSSTGNTITVSKVVENDPGDGQTFSMSLLQNGGEYDSFVLAHGESKAFNDVPAGTYTIAEAIPEGYELVSVSPSSVTIRGRNRSESFVVTTRFLGGAGEDPIEYSRTLIPGEGFDADVPYGTSETDAKGALLPTVPVEGTQGGETVTGEAAIDWSIADYDGQTAGTYEATGILTLPEGWDGNPADVNATVRVLDKPAIVFAGLADEEESFDIAVDYGTSEEDALALLADSVAIVGTGGEEGAAAVGWTFSGTYEGLSPGDYDAEGELRLPDGWVWGDSGPRTVVAVVTVGPDPGTPPDPDPDPDPEPDVYVYLALGDSLATGSTSRGTTTSYVHGFRSDLESFHNKPVIMENRAVDGDDSSDLLNKLNTNSAMQAAVEDAHIITLSIGGNNIMPAARASSFSSIDTAMAEEGTGRFEAEYGQIIDRIRELNPQARVIVMTLFNPYNTVALRGYETDPALHLEAQGYIGRINAAIREEDAWTTVVDVHGAFLDYANRGKMGDITYFYPHRWFKFTRDPHPNQTGQNLMQDLHRDGYTEVFGTQTVMYDMAA